MLGVDEELAAVLRVEQAEDVRAGASQDMVSEHIEARVPGVLPR